MVHHQIQHVFTAAQTSLIRYWLALPRRIHDLVPCKKDIKLPPLARIAPLLGIAEDGGPDALHVRLMGSTVGESIGKETQNSNAYENCDDDAHKWSYEFFRGIWDTPMGGKKTLTHHFSRKPLYSLKTMHLPLCDEDGKCRFVISTFERGDTVIDLEEYEPSPIRAQDLSDIVAIDIGAGTSDLSPLPSQGRHRNQCLPCRSLFLSLVPKK